MIPIPIKTWAIEHIHAISGMSAINPIPIKIRLKHPLVELLSAPSFSDFNIKKPMDKQITAISKPMPTSDPSGSPKSGI